MRNLQHGLNIFLLTTALSFNAAAQDDREHDFQIPAEHFQSGAVPGITAQDVPIYCSEDFNWAVEPPQPKLDLLERIDTRGFGGGVKGRVAFLLMDDQERVRYANALWNRQAVKDLKTVALEYDNADNQVRFAEEMMNDYHQWPPDRNQEVAKECENRGLDSP